MIQGVRSTYYYYFKKKKKKTKTTQEKRHVATLLFIYVKMLRVSQP